MVDTHATEGLQVPAHGVQYYTWHQATKVRAAAVSAMLNECNGTSARLHCQATRHQHDCISRRCMTMIVLLEAESTY